MFLYMEEHHLQIWDTEGARLGQQKAIRKQGIQELLLKARNFYSSTPASQRTS